MRIPAFTLASEIVLASRRSFIAIAGILIAAGLFGMLPLASLRPGGLLNELMNLPMVLSIVLLFAVFNYTEQHPRTGTTGFPHRLFTFPVSTFTLVTCPIVCGVLGVIALYSVWILLIFRPIGKDFLLAWPLLVLGCGMVCYHCVLWSLAGYRLVRMIVLSLLGTSLLGIALLPMIYGNSASQSRVATLFIVMAIGAYVIALASVHRQRHAGGVRSSAGLFLQRMLELIPTSNAPFRSPAHALFWLEFRRSGLILPFATAVVLLCFIFMAVVSYPMPAEVTALAFMWAAPLPLILSAFVGKSFSSDSNIPSFIVIRPASAGELLFAKLRAAAMSTAISWLVVMLLVPIWLMLCDRSQIRGWWDAGRAFLGTRVFVIVPLVFASLMLLTWKLLIGSTPTGLLGRPRLYVVHSVLSVALLIAAAITVPWLIDGIAAGRIRLTFINHDSTIPVLGLVVFLKLSLATYLWRRGLIFGLLHARQARLYLALWLLSTAIFLACAYVLFSTPPFNAQLRYLMPLAALGLFPLARIPLAAISLASNRHR